MLKDMTNNNIEHSTLTPDTEAILLLCGRFGAESGDQYKPLTQKEYESLTQWLLERKIRPADLLNLDAAVFADLIHAKLDCSRIDALLHRGTALALSLEKWRRSGLWVLSRSDISYPRRLKKILGQSAPPLLFGAGDQNLLNYGGVAIVGSRDVSESGLTFTADLARACVKSGFGIVSGGAKGVDASAMQAGSEAGGIVIGVLAADLLRASVIRENRQGIQAGQLVLVSPFNPESGFSVGAAMARNRYIYALADYAVVVDSAEDTGGTWAGAIENLKKGWTPLYIRDSNEKPGNYGLMAKGGIKFSYTFDGHESIKSYFESNANNQNTPAIAPILESGAIESLRGDLKKLTLDNSIQIAKDSESGLPTDVLNAFVEGVTAILNDGARTGEDIRIILGLKKDQIKALLASAVSNGYIVKQKTPVMYSLPKQKSLC